MSVCMSEIVAGEEPHQHPLLCTAPGLPRTGLNGKRRGPNLRVRKYCQNEAEYDAPLLLINVWQARRKLSTCSEHHINFCHV